MCSVKGDAARPAPGVHAGTPENTHSVRALWCQRLAQRSSQSPGHPQPLASLEGSPLLSQPLGVIPAAPRGWEHSLEPGSALHPVSGAAGPVLLAVRAAGARVCVCDWAWGAGYPRGTRGLLELWLPELLFSGSSPSSLPWSPSLFQSPHLPKQYLQVLPGGSCGVGLGLFIGEGFVCGSGPEDSWFVSLPAPPLSWETFTARRVPPPQSFNTAPHPTPLQFTQPFSGAMPGSAGLPG